MRQTSLTTEEIVDYISESKSSSCGHKRVIVSLSNGLQEWLQLRESLLRTETVLNLIYSQMFFDRIFILFMLDFIVVTT